MEAPIIIGIDSRKEYLAAVVLSAPPKRPVAIVSPERENPGIAAKPWATAISKDSFNVIFFLVLSFLETFSLCNNIIPVSTNIKPTKSGLNTRLSALSLRAYAIITEISVPKIIYIPVLKFSEV